jgi:hypothetical protein
MSSALLTAAFGGLMGVGFPPTRAALVAAARLFIHGSPGASFGFAFRDPASLVSFFNVFGFTFLFVRVFVFISSWHCCTSPFLRKIQLKNSGSFDCFNQLLHQTVAFAPKASVFVKRPHFIF